MWAENNKERVNRWWSTAVLTRSRIPTVVTVAQTVEQGSGITRKNYRKLYTIEYKGKNSQVGALPKIQKVSNMPWENSHNFEESKNKSAPCSPKNDFIWLKSSKITNLVRKVFEKKFLDKNSTVPGS